MKSQVFYIFRHGETYFSKNKVPYGDSELTAHILEESKPSIKKIAQFLNNNDIDLSLRSAFLRCRETVALIEENSNLKFIEDSLLNEYTENDFNNFKDRMNLLTRKLQTINKANIAICTHGAVIAALQKILLNKDFKSQDLLGYPSTGVILKIENEVVNEIDFNG